MEEITSIPADDILGKGNYEYKSLSRGGVKTRNKKVKSTVRWSLFEFGADVSVDIMIGLGIASLLLAYLPLDWISAFLGQQDLLTLAYVIILGIPVYACSIPSIPVIQGLLLLGASPGAAIAYMISGPATNLGELNAIRKAMGLKPALFYASSLILIALLAGLITDQIVFPDYQYHALRVEGELVVNQCCVPIVFGEKVGTMDAAAAIPQWHWPFGIVMIAIIVYGVFTKLRHFFINPCASCNWKTYGPNGFCGSKCHVRRNFEFMRNLKIIQHAFKKES